MDYFPPYLSPTKVNKSTFSALNMSNILRTLRCEVTSFILRANEHDSYGLGAFYESHHVTGKTKDMITSTIIKELSDMGWKCKTSPNGKELFVYSIPACHIDTN